MRKYLALIGALVTLASCGEGSNSTEVIAGDVTSIDAATGAVLSGGLSMGLPRGIPGRGLPHIGKFDRLPDSLALSAAQEAEINTLVEAYKTTNQAAIDSLAAVYKSARTAWEGGATRTEVEAILATGSALRDRLEAAEDVLKAAVDAILTDAQKAWLAANRRGRCDLSATPLTTEQQAQITALSDAFKTANQADIDAVRAAHDAAHAARREGRTQAEIDAIKAAVQPAMERLQAAGEKLRADINALLTAEQLASGCFTHGIGIGGFRFGRDGHGGRGHQRGAN